MTKVLGENTAIKATLGLIVTGAVVIWWARAEFEGLKSAGKDRNTCGMSVLDNCRANLAHCRAGSDVQLPLPVCWSVNEHLDEDEE